MAFAGITKTVHLPHLPEHHVTIRKVAGRVLRNSRHNASTRNLGLISALAPVYAAQERGSEMQAIEEEARRRNAAEAADPLQGHDLDTLLPAGIVSWSFDRKCDPKNIAELDEETEKVVGREIVLFSQAPTEESEKNS